MFAPHRHGNQAPLANFALASVYKLGPKQVCRGRRRGGREKGEGGREKSEVHTG